MKVIWRVYDKTDGQRKEDCFSDSDGTVKNYETDIPNEELDDCVSDLERNELINAYIRADFNEWVDYVWTTDGFEELDSEEDELEDEDPLVT